METDRIKKALEITRYKYFGDYELSTTQIGALNTLIELAEEVLKESATPDELINALDTLFDPDEAVWLDTNLREIAEGSVDKARFVLVPFSDYMRAVSTYLSARLQANARRTNTPIGDLFDAVILTR